MLPSEPTDFTVLPKFDDVPEASKTPWFCAKGSPPVWKGWYELRLKNAEKIDPAVVRPGYLQPKKAWWDGRSFIFREKVPWNGWSVTSAFPTEYDEWRGVTVEVWSPYTTEKKGRRR